MHIARKHFFVYFEIKENMATRIVLRSNRAILRSICAFSRPVGTSAEGIPEPGILQKEYDVLRKEHEALRKEHEALLEESKELQDKYRRALAETENVRTRGQRQVNLYIDNFNSLFRQKMLRCLPSSRSVRTYLKLRIF